MVKAAESWAVKTMVKKVTTSGDNNNKKSQMNDDLLLIVSYLKMCNNKQKRKEAVLDGLVTEVKDNKRKPI